jgi:acetyltransferase
MGYAVERSYCNAENEVLMFMKFLPKVKRQQPGITTRTRRARTVRIRHIQPADAQLLLDLFGRISANTYYSRFMRPPAEQTASQRWPELVRLASVDVHTQVTLIATADEHGRPVAVGLAQLVRDQADPAAAELALLIRDDYQGEGVGSTLLDLLAQAAMVRGIRRLFANTLAENVAMRRIARQLGLPIDSQTSHGETTITISVLDS